MNQYLSAVISLGRKPSAFVPMAMSLLALAVVLVHILNFGTVRDVDEGPSAHAWQLLMAGQLPILAYFLIKWLPRVPRHALSIFGLQIGAALAAMAPVFLLGL